MSQQLSPFVEGKYGWNYGESGWNTGMDENLLKFSFLFDNNIDQIVSSLPPSESGKSYFLTTDNRMYYGVNNNYFSVNTPKWFKFKLRSTGQEYVFNGTSVVSAPTNSELSAEIDEIVSNLGTASTQATEFFASKSQLDVAQAQNSAELDTFQQDLLGVNGSSLVFDGSVSVKEKLLSNYKSIVPGNGVADDMPKITAALATTSRIVFPETSTPYTLKSNATVTLTKDTVIDFNGQQSIWTNSRLTIKSPTVATGLTLAANVPRYASVLTLSSGTGIQRGDLVYITTTLKPSPDWNDSKKDCVLVSSVSGNTVNLSDTVNFSYTTSDAGLSIKVYRPFRLELRNLNALLIAAESDPTPYVQIELEGVHGLNITNPIIRGQLPFGRDTNPYRVGIQTIACRSVTIADPTYEAMSYQIGIYGGTRHVTETNVNSYYCHHGHADVGDWSSDYTLDGMKCADNYQSVNTHPCFRAYVKNIDVHNDYGLSYLRCVGGGISDATIRSTVGEGVGSELPQYSNIPMNAGFEYLYDDADIYFNNIDMRCPNRITKATMGVRFGRTVSIAAIKCNDFITSFAARDQVKQLIVGTGNRIGALSSPTPGSSLTLCPARIDFDIPLDANLISSIYNIDPRLTMVPHSSGRLVCRGSVFAKRSVASPVTSTLRIHVNAFSTQSQVNILNGKLKLFATIAHSSSGAFSTQEKHFNFSFTVQATSALYFPTTAVYTSGLSGQIGEGVVVSLTAPTFAGVSQIGSGGDNYIDVPVTLTGAGTSPVFTLSYELELDLVS